MRSDFDLLDAWRGGDREAGNELFHRHFDPVCRFFRNKVSDGVEDLIQRTFLACVESRDRFRKEASFRTYLFTVARNELYTHLQARRRDAVPFDPQDVSVDALLPSPSKIVVDHAQQKLLLSALRRIPLDHQLILELFYWEGLTAGELGRVLETPEGTIRTRIRKARKVLEEKMRELAADGSDVETTIANLEQWARSLKDQLPSEIRKR